MTVKSEEKRKKLILRTLLYGAVTAAMYAAMFVNPGPVAELFARGGLYAALPIATVFAVSFAHGAFSSNLWSVLGIEASTKQTVKRPTVSAPRPAQRPRPRLRMSA